MTYTQKHFTFLKHSGLIAAALFVSASGLSAFVLEDFDVDKGSGVESQGSFETTYNSGLLPVSQQVASGAGLTAVNTFDSTGGLLEVFTVYGYDLGGDFVDDGSGNDTTFGVPQTGFLNAYGDRVSWSSGYAGSSSSPDFAYDWGLSIDVYFDDPNSGSYSVGDGFYVDTKVFSAGNNPAAAQNAGGFGIAIADTGGSSLEWQIGADGIGKGFSDVTGSVASIGSALSGWYTLETVWVPGAVGIDQVNRVIRRSDGSVLLETTLEEQFTLASGLGLPNSITIGHGDTALGTQTSSITALVLDNPTVVPEPSAYVLLAGLFASGLVFSRRRRD